MNALHHVGAVAPGQVTPELTQKDETPGLAGAEGFRGKNSDGGGDGTCKLIATAIARAALLGIEARPLTDGAWLLRHARGADIGIVHGIGALTAAVAGFEAACSDVRALMQRMRRSA